MPLPEFTIKHYAGKVTYQVRSRMAHTASSPHARDTRTCCSLALLILSCVILAKSLYLSEPQLSHQKSGNNSARGTPLSSADMVKRSAHQQWSLLLLSSWLFPALRCLRPGFQASVPTGPHFPHL